ncbi:MAG TPA: hypothetical protein VGF17_18730, partial [Phytomonospora sp.]
MRLADLLLDFAARRWPADIRAEQRKEWEAEMHAIRHDPSTGALLRSLRPLRFAFSLAASPPADDGHGVPRGWRELVPEHGRRLTPVLLLVVATSVAAALGSVLPALAYTFTDGFITLWDDYPVQSAETIWTVGVTVVLVTTALAVAGVWLAARFAMPSALKAFGVVTGTLLAMSLAAPDWPGYLQPQVIATPFTGAVTITAWGAALFAVTAVATRLLRNRTRAALAVSAGALVVLDLVAVAFAAPVLAAGDMPPRTFPEALHGLLWFPLSLVSTQVGVSGSAADRSLTALLNPWMSVLLAVTAFAVAYVLRSRRGGKAVAPAPAVGRASQPLAPLRWTAGPLGTVAFGTWVWTLAVVTPAGSATWIVEARLTAVLATVLAGAVVLTGRGRPLLAAIIAAPALVAAAPAAEPFAIDTPRAVREEAFVPLNGVEQWVTIRGEDRRNPALV